MERVDRNDAAEIVAVCRRGRKRQRISIVDLPLPEPKPKGAEWIEAFRRWAAREMTMPGKGDPGDLRLWIDAGKSILFYPLCALW